MLLGSNHDWEFLVAQVGLNSSRGACTTEQLSTDLSRSLTNECPATLRTNPRVAISPFPKQLPLRVSCLSELRVEYQNL